MRPSEQTIKQYKLKICEIAKVFDAFCNKHDLRYFGIGGTAIGALRHKGIIPWDDDIDFVMPRPDYERFLLLCDELLPQYDVFEHRRNTLYHLTMAKMCDANTSLIDSFRQHLITGAFIDIFPIDGCPGATKEDRAKFFNDYRKLRAKGEAIQNWYPWRDILSAIHMCEWRQIPLQLLSHWYHLTGKRNTYFEQCDKILMTNPYEEAEYVAYFSTYRSAKIISPRKWFDSYYYVPFEDFEIRLPIGIHDYLTQLFGNYMQEPPIEKRIAQHSFGYLNLHKRVTWDEAKKDAAKRNNVIQT